LDKLNDGILQKLEEIKKAGGTVVEEKAPEGEHGYVAKFTDIEGNVMGLYEVRCG